MNYRLTRISAAFLPAALIAAHLLGAADRAEDLFFVYMLMQLFSLCPAEAFRNAAAREPGVRRVDKRFGAAVSQLLIGCALFAAALYLLCRGSLTVPDPAASFDPRQLIPLGGTAALIILEQMFEERLYAVGRAVDGAILSALSCALLLTGLLVDASESFPALPFALCGAGLGALIGLVFTLAAQPFQAYSPLPRNYGYVPKALAQFMLYPALCFAAQAFFPVPDGFSVCTGWLLWRLSRSYARRSRDESRPLALLLTAACALLLNAVWLWPPLQNAELTAIAALLCAEALFLHPSLRLYAGTAMLIGAACVYSIVPYGYYISVVLSFAATALNLKDAFLRKNARPTRF